LSSEVVCVDHPGRCPNCGSATGRLRLESDRWTWTCGRCGFELQV
jgi:ribosomal protein S27AE